MNNLKELRSIVRNIISERFEGRGSEFKSSINKGYWQSIDLGKGAPNEKNKKNGSGKENVDTLNPFKNNIKFISEFDNLFKKISLNIQKNNKSLLENEEFKKLNEEYRKLFEFFIDNGKIPGGLERFLKDKLNPFLKNNPKYLKFKDLKDFYGL